MKWKGRKGSDNVIDKTKPGFSKNRGRKNNGKGDRVDMLNSRNMDSPVGRRVSVYALPGKSWNTIGKSSQHGTGYGPRTRKRR